MAFFQPLDHYPISWTEHSLDDSQEGFPSRRCLFQYVFYALFPGNLRETGAPLLHRSKAVPPCEDRPTPIPHRSSSIFSTKFHPRKIFFSHDRLHQIFPKTISPENFPGFSQKIFPAHAMNARFAIFQKRRIAPFARIPATSPYLMQPTHKNRKLCRSLKKKFVRTLRNFNRKNFQNLFWQRILNGE